MIDHKKPGVALWATVGLVVVLVGYPLSVGPARFAYFKAGEPYWLGTVIDVLYASLWWAFEYGLRWLWFDVFSPYIGWWNSLT